MPDRLVVDEDVHAQEIVADEREQGDVHPHVQRQADAAHDHEVAERIDRVVEEVPVDRPLETTMPGEAPVERITEPVDREADRGEPKEGRMGAARDVADQGQQRAQDAEDGQAIWRHPRGKARAQPVEELPLAARDDVRLDAGDPEPSVRRSRACCHEKASPARFGRPAVAGDHGRQPTHVFRRDTEEKAVGAKMVHRNPTAPRCSTKGVLGHDGKPPPVGKAICGKTPSVLAEKQGASPPKDFGVRQKVVACRRFVGYR